MPIVVTANLLIIQFRTTVPENAVNIDHYCSPPECRNLKDRIGGGVICYIHKDLPYDKMPRLKIENFEAVWIKLKPHRLFKYYRKKNRIERMTRQILLYQ